LALLTLVKNNPRQLPIRRALCTFAPSNFRNHPNLEYPVPAGPADQIANLKNAIRALDGQRALLGDPVVEASITAMQNQLAELEGKLAPVEQQRKLATLLFTDIVDHTTLIQHLDPEDNLHIIDRALVLMAAPVEAHGGHIARFQGDGFKAIFGVPVARENDPEMAIRAGLGIIAAAQAYAGELAAERGLHGFAVRVGIDTGLAVTGGQTEAEDTIKGLVVNLAARLEAAAPPGGVLISHHTYQHVRGIFEVEPLAPLTVRGFLEPVQVYLVRSAKPRAFRLFTRGVEGVETRMVGRKTELKHLQDALQTAIGTDSCQVVTTVAEAGVGKSRLLYEFENWLELSPTRVRLYKGRATEEMENAPYALLRRLFAFQFQIQDSDPAARVRQKFEAGIAGAFERGAPLAAGETIAHANGPLYAHFIGQLIGFDFSASPYLQGILDDTQQIHDRARLYLGEYFRAITAQSPTVMFLEDIHWADDQSLDLFHYLLQVLEQRSCLTVCNARPTFFERRPGWGQALPAHRRLDLAPLSRQDSRTLVAEIMKKAAQVPLVLRELVVGGAEGNPFYIEELIKMLIEDGVILKGEDQWQVEPTHLLALEVPPTLTGVLQARLDSLPPLERMILQQASVVGHVFWQDVIRALNASTDGGTDDPEIFHALQSLERKEMIAFSGSEYTFKHSILRNVTYESVLKRLRQVYHLLTAEWLIEHSGERAGEFTGMIADHLERGGEPRQAATYLHRAGQKAAAQYANAEAIQFLGRALELIPASEAGARFEILLARAEVFSLKGAREAQVQDLLALGALAESLDEDARRAEVALLRARAASELSQYAVVIAASQEANRLGGGLARIEAGASLLWGRALVSQGDYPAAQTHFERALSLAQSARLAQIEADSLRHLGLVAERLGDTAQAMAQYERALETCRSICDRRGEGHTLNQLGNICMIRGEYGKGQDYYQQFLAICREIGDRWGEGMVIRDMAAVHLEQANFSRATDYFQQALQITHEIGNRTLEGGALEGLGNISLEQSEYAQAKVYFEQSLHIARNIGNRPMEAKTLADIGRFFHRQGDYLRAQSYYSQGLQIQRTLGNRTGECQVMAFQALAAFHLGDFDGAQETARQARQIAQEIGHRSHEALAATHLGHALLGLGQVDEAVQAYQLALEIYRNRINSFAITRSGLALEPLAGLANTHLKQDNLAAAHSLVDEILHHLQQSPAGPSDPAPTGGEIRGLEGVADPFQVYLTLWQVLRAVGDARAPEVLATAHHLLTDQAAKIADLDLRHAFLHHVAVNREIQSAWEQESL